MRYSCSVSRLECCFLVTERRKKKKKEKRRLTLEGSSIRGDN